MGEEIALIIALLPFDFGDLGSMPLQPKFVFALLAFCLRDFGVVLRLCIVEV